MLSFNSKSLVCSTSGSAICDENLLMHFSSDVVVYLFVDFTSIGMILSSHINKIKFKSNKLIKKDEINNLKKDSIVKTDVIYKILQNQILYKIGSVDKEKIEYYKKSFLKNN